MLRVYLAGPISGRPNRNAAAFDSAAAAWRAAGHTVLNPIEAAGGAELGWEPALRLGFELLFAADALALLPGWEGSRGATLEAAVSVACQLPVYDAETMAPLGPLVARWWVERADGGPAGGGERTLAPAGPPVPDDDDGGGR